jgi:hypothetical protein
MICAMALVNDIFDKPQKDAIRMQGLQVEVVVVK